MTDDDILRELGKVARDQKASEETQSVEDVVRPLDPAVLARIALQAEASLNGEPKPLAQVIPLRERRPRWRAAMVAVPLALAASLALWVGIQSSVDPLPPYSLSLSGGVQELRGAANDSELLVLGSDVELQLLLRPSRGVQGPVETRLFVVENGRARLWPAKAEVSEQGSVLIKAKGADLQEVKARKFELVLVIARPAELPSAEGLESAGSSVQVFRREATWQ